jgi:hypothetical protein
MFKHLRNSLSEKMACVTLAETRLREPNPQKDVVAFLTSDVLGKEFVLFCGAGISVPAPSFAPGFLELRDALILAIARLLTKHRVTTKQQEIAISEALELLHGRLDIAFPPELIFSFVREALGNEIVVRILSCLNEGSPNENHIAIRRLAEQKSTGLSGIITTNFDTYIERAFAGMPFGRHVVALSKEGEGFPLLKPHGTLDEPTSILVTLEQVALRLDDIMRDTLNRLVANRTLVVVGYSGWDYDLFPLLVHAGRHWNTRIVWVLWDESSMNTQVGGLQIALGDRCIVLNGEKRAVLAELSGLKLSHSPARSGDLVTKFTEAMRNCPKVALIKAFTEVADPIGVPERLGIREYLASVLLDEVRLGRAESDDDKLKHLLVLARNSEDRSTRDGAIDIGKRIALESGKDAWVRQFEYLRSMSLETEESESELNEIEFDLSEDFFPHLDELPDPARAKKSMTIYSLIRKANILIEMEEFDEAEELTHYLLSNFSFPGSGVSSEAWMLSDGKAEGELHRIIAEVCQERGSLQEAEKELCMSLDIFWRELDFSELDLTLDSIRRLTLLEDNECAEMALSLSTAIPRVTGNIYMELENLINKLDVGFGNRQDITRAKSLFSQVEHRLGEDKREECIETLTRFARVYNL